MKLFYIGLLFLLLFVACNSPTDSPNTIRIALAERITSLDPLAYDLSYSNQVIQAQLYQTLFEVGDDRLIYPAIAKSYEFIHNEDFCVHIKLRSDVYFAHWNGSQWQKQLLKAQDVVFSLERLRKQPESAAVKFFIDKVARIEAQNEDVYIYLNEPYYALHNLLAAPYFAIIPQATKQTQVGKFSSGPYALISSGTEDFLLEPNPFYFKKDFNYKTLPYISKIHMRCGKADATDRSALFFKRLNDIFLAHTRIEQEIFTKDAEIYAHKATFYQEEIPLAEALVLNFYTDSSSTEKMPLWQSYVGSRALRYATNTDSIIKNSEQFWKKSQYNQIYDFYFPTNLEVKNNRYTYDSLKARQLFDRMPMDSYDSTLCVLDDKVEAEILANHWRNLGLNLKQIHQAQGNYLTLKKVSLSFFEELQTWYFLDTAFHASWYLYAELAHKHKEVDRREFFYNEARNYTNKQIHAYPLCHRIFHAYIAEDLKGISWRYDGTPLFEHAKKDFQKETQNSNLSTHFTN